jgi:hypothetical protein
LLGLPALIGERSAFLLRGRWGRPLRFFVSPLRQLRWLLRAWRAALLRRSRRIGARAILLPGSVLLRLAALLALSRHGCGSLRRLFLIVLLHDGVTRLVTVILIV